MAGSGKRIAGYGKKGESSSLTEGMLSKDLYAAGDSLIAVSGDKEGTIIVSDVHLGYDYQYDDLGIRFLLKGDGSVFSKIMQLRDRYKAMLGIKVSGIAFNGDIIDDFALKNSESRRSINLFFSRMSSEFSRVYLIRGNHDKMLDTLSLKDNCTVSEYLILGRYIVVHGDRSLSDLKAYDELKKEGTAGITAIIMGHEHPVLRLDDNIREEKYKCIVIFDDVLASGFRARVYLMPAFNPNIEGTDVLQQSFMSPLLSNALPTRSRILVYDENSKVYLDFGSISDASG